MATEAKPLQPVLSRSDFVNRYIANEFGNRPFAWSSLIEFLRMCLVNKKSRDDYRFSLQHKTLSGCTHYNRVWSDIVVRWNSAYDPEDWWVIVEPPFEVQESTVIQGEVVEEYPDDSHKGLRLFYSVAKLPLYSALQTNPRYICGKIGVEILQKTLCPKSYAQLLSLVTSYPRHVVEFSVYDQHNWQTLYPDLNAVFWAVRRY